MKCPLSGCTEVYADTRNLVKHVKKYHDIKSVQLKYNPASIEIMKQGVPKEENSMEVDVLVEPTSVLTFPSIGPHRQARDHNISDRHHPYTRTTSISGTDMLELVLSTSEQGTPTGK